MNFNTGINGTYHVGEWYDAQENSYLFPYLRYVSVLIESTREEHAELHGVIADLDDAFWNEHYPPNGWNCLCGIEQLTFDEAESDPMFGKEPPDIDIQENFQNNPGKDQIIWGDWLKGKL